MEKPSTSVEGPGRQGVEVLGERLSAGLLPGPHDVTQFGVTGGECVQLVAEQEVAVGAPDLAADDLYDGVLSFVRGLRCIQQGPGARGHRLGEARERR